MSDKDTPGTKIPYAIIDVSGSGNECFYNCLKESLENYKFDIYKDNEDVKIYLDDNYKINTNNLKKYLINYYMLEHTYDEENRNYESFITNFKAIKDSTNTEHIGAPEEKKDWDYDRMEYKYMHHLFQDIEEIYLNNDEHTKVINKIKAYISYRHLFQNSMINSTLSTALSNFLKEKFNIKIIIITTNYTISSNNTDDKNIKEIIQQQITVESIESERVDEFTNFLVFINFGNHYNYLKINNKSYFTKNELLDFINNREEKYILESYNKSRGGSKYDRYIDKNNSKYNRKIYIQNGKKYVIYKSQKMLLKEYKSMLKYSYQSQKKKTKK